jgi:hypothetical protein
MLAHVLGSGSSGHRSSSSSILDHFLNVGEEVISTYIPSIDYTSFVQYIFIKKEMY